MHTHKHSHICSWLASRLKLHQLDYCLFLGLQKLHFSTQVELWAQPRLLTVWSLLRLKQWIPRCLQGLQVGILLQTKASAVNLPNLRPRHIQKWDSHCPLTLISLGGGGRAEKPLVTKRRVCRKPGEISSSPENEGITKEQTPQESDKVRSHSWNSHCGAVETNLTINHEVSHLIPGLSGLTIQQCCELWYRSQTWLRSCVAVAVV